VAYTAPRNYSAASIATDAEAHANRAFQILHFGFFILPMIAGIDKFFDILANWDRYLAPIVPATLKLSAHAFIEALWLLGIIGNLAHNPEHHWDIAARDFGLFLGALALGSLAAWSARRQNPRAE
jgi:hypothetical protein